MLKILFESYSTPLFLAYENVGYLIFLYPFLWYGHGIFLSESMNLMKYFEFQYWNSFIILILNIIWLGCFILFDTLLVQLDSALLRISVSMFTKDLIELLLSVLFCSWFSLLLFFRLNFYYWPTAISSVLCILSLSYFMESLSWWFYFFRSKISTVFL